MDQLDHIDDNEMLMELTAEVVAAYVSNNSLAVADLPSLITDVYGALGRTHGGPAAPVAEKPKPAVPVKKSVSDDYIVCLEDGKRLKMLKRWRMGEIDSWAIRFCYAEARQNGLTVYPTTSKVENIGFTGESTNTHGYNRYRTRLDTGTQEVFSLPDDMTCLPHYVQHMRWKYSLPVRAANRLLTHALKAQRWMGKSD